MPAKVLARILLDRVRQKLLTLQRHEKSCFTHKKSTVDRILALHVLTERLREFRTRLLAAYVHLRKVSERRCTLEKPRPPRNTPKFGNLISGLNSVTESVVSCAGTISDYLPINIDVRHGCFLAQTHFSTCMDHGLARISEESGCGVSF